MKNLLILFLFYCIATFAKAQSPTWAWAKEIPAQVQTSNFAYPTMDTDASDNIYLGGCFSDGALILGNDTLKKPYSGTSHLYVAKYSPNGDILWGRAADSSDSHSETKALCTDSSGNVYIAGTFGKYLKFGTKTLTANGSASKGLFIAKYNANGDLLWATAESYDGSILLETIKVDHLGGIYIGGHFNGNKISFGADTLRNLNFQKSPAGFLAKYDKNGNISWSRKVGCVVSSIVVERKGNIYICGGYYDSLISGSLVFNNNGNNSGYIVKFDANGGILWTKSTTNLNGTGRFTSVGQDADNNIYLFGTYSGSVKFDSVVIDDYGYLIVKLRENGDLVSAKNLRYSGLGGIKNVSVTPDGRLLISGIFYTSLRLENQIIYPYIKRAAVNTPNIFLGSIGADGRLSGLSVIPSGERGADISEMKLLPQGNLLIAGILYDYALFGNDSITNADGFFLAKTDNLLTSAKELPLGNSDFTIYPNPTANFFYIQSQEPIDVINIYNLTGQLIHSYQAADNTGGYDISSINNGVYIVEIQTKNIQRFAKLIKQ